MSAIALAIISIGDNEDVLLRVLFKDSVANRLTVIYPDLDQLLHFNNLSPYLVSFKVTSSLAHHSLGLH